MTRDKVELTANISVIVSAVLFCFVLFSNYILPSHTGEKHQVTGRAEGTTLKLDGVIGRIINDLWLWQYQPTAHIAFGAYLFISASQMKLPPIISMQPSLLRYQTT